MTGPAPSPSVGEDSSTSSSPASHFIWEFSLSTTSRALQHSSTFHHEHHRHCTREPYGSAWNIGPSCCILRLHSWIHSCTSTCAAKGDSCLVSFLLYYILSKSWNTPAEPFALPPVITKRVMWTDKPGSISHPAGSKSTSPSDLTRSRALDIRVSNLRVRMRCLSWGGRSGSISRGRTRLARGRRTSRVSRTVVCLYFILIGFSVEVDYNGWDLGWSGCCWLIPRCSGAKGVEYPQRFFARDYAGNRLEFSLWGDRSVRLCHLCQGLMILQFSFSEILTTCHRELWLEHGALWLQ